jgi:hypothetical protein
MQIAGPSVSESTFSTNLTNVTNSSISTILSAAQVEPCSGDDRYNSAGGCVFNGFINFTF